MFNHGSTVWDKIPQITKKLVLANKEERPDLFELEYYGFEYNDNDPSIYVLRGYRKYINEFNLQDFYNTNTKRSKDHTVFLMSGYKLNENGNYDKYIIEEKVTTPQDALNLNDTIEHYGQWIINCFDKFDRFENTTFHYDINAHDFMQLLQKELVSYLGYKIKMFKAIKHQTTLNKDAGLNN